jgi:hypothetical protein
MIDSSGMDAKDETNVLLKARKALRVVVKTGTNTSSASSKHHSLFPWVVPAWGASPVRLASESGRGDIECRAGKKT